MKAQRNTLFPILIWIALFSFCVSAQGVNDTNRLTVTTEDGESQTITDSYTISTAGTYTFTGSYIEETVTSGPLHVIEVNSSGDVIIILKNANIKLTNSSRDNPNCNLIKINNDSRVTLQLIGDNSLELNKRTGFQGGSQAAIEVCQNASLTIQSADNNDATGKLTVKSIGGNWGGAAIGSKAGSYDDVNRHEKAGAITINSGTIIATSEVATQGAAAIGGGVQGDATSIIINGGVITAKGGVGYNHAGAGIGGGGNKGAVGKIVINGGYITAIGGTDGVGHSSAPGIGGGNLGNNGTFSTGANGHAVIIASSIAYQTNKASWSGLIFEGNEGKIYGNGNTFTLSQNIEIPEGKELTISEGQSLNVSSYTLTNNGTIINRGTINGTVGGSGTVIHQTKLKEEMISPIEPVDYNGQAQKPTVNISSYTEGTDYTLEYSNNTNAGNATVTVTPKEEGKLYSDDPVSKTFTIQPKPLSFTFNGIDSPILYDGAEHEATVTPNVVGGDNVSTTLTYQKQNDDGQFTVITGKPKDAGTYKVIVSQISGEKASNYFISNTETEKSKTFTISQATNRWTTELSMNGWTYGETANEPSAAAAQGSATYKYYSKVADSEEYVSLDAKPTNAGTWYVKASVTGVANYNDLTSGCVEFVIAKATPTITLNVPTTAEDLIYDGNPKTVTASVSGVGLISTTVNLSYKVKDADDATYAETAPQNAGSYTVKASYDGDANHKEAMKTANFTIQPKELTAEMVKLDSESFTYNGRAQQPNISATDATLNEAINVTPTWSTEYTYTNVGTYNVTVTASGNYTGSTTKSYSIAKATPTYEVPAGLTATYGQILAEVTLLNGWTWEEADTTPVGIVGTNKFHAKFTPEDTDNYNVVDQVEVSILVIAADPHFTFAEPSLTITQGEEVPENALTKPEDCTVTYTSNDPEVATVDAETGEVTVVGVGTAIITATAGGNYSGTATYKLTVKAAYNPPSDPVYYTVTIPTEVTGAIIHDGGTHEVEAYTYLTFRIELDPNGNGQYPTVTTSNGMTLTHDGNGNYRFQAMGDTQVMIGEVPGYSYYLLTLPQETQEESDSTFWSAEGIEVVGAAAVPAMRAVSDSETGRFMAPFGTMVTLRPIETAERKFLQWENGSTERERTLTLRADEEIRALWQKVSAVGIEEIAANSLIRGERGQLCIEVPVSCDAVIYSYNGVPVRMAHLTEGSNRIHSLPAGLYLVQIGHARAVAVRVR